MVLPTRGQRDWDDELNNEIQRLDSDVQSAVANASSAVSNANSARTSADAAAAAAAQSATSAQTAADSATAPTDETVAAKVNDTTSQTRAALSATIVEQAVPYEQRPDLFPSQYLSYSKGGRIGTDGRVPVALRFDDGQDDIIRLDVLTELRNRQLFGSIVLVSQLGANNWNQVVTWDDLRTWNRDYGMEVWSHGTNHGTPVPDGYDGFYREIIQSKADIEAQGIRVMGFAMPGVEAPGYGPELDRGDWTSLAGRMLQATYGVVETDMTGPWRNVPSELRYGLGHVTISDGPSLASAKEDLDAAIDAGQGIEFMIHTTNLDLSGNMTFVEFTQFLDYIVTKRDAGEIEFVTPSTLPFCDPTTSYRQNLTPNGDFSRPLPATSRHGNWNPTSITGSPNSIVTVPDGPHGVGANVLRLGQSGAYAKHHSWSGTVGSGLAGQTMLLDFWARAEDDSVALGGTRVIAQGGTWTTFFRDFKNLTTTWQRFRVPFTVPPTEEVMVVSFGRAYSGASEPQVADVKLYPA